MGQSVETGKGCEVARAAAGKGSGAVFVAIESFAVEMADGSTALIHQGVTRAREGHEVMSGGLRQFWAPVDDRVDYDVEQATAAPGEMRGGTPAAGG